MYKKLNNEPYYVTFSLLTANKEVISSYDRVTCFRRIFNDVAPTELRYIRYCIEKEETPYDLDFIIWYTNLISEMGFLISYEGEDSDNYNFLLDVAALQGKRILINSTLTIIRYLKEKTLNAIPQVMYDFIQAGEHPFIALQRAHCTPLLQVYDKKGTYRHTGHALLSFTERRTEDCITQEQFFQKVDNSDASIYENSDVGVIAFWSFKP